MRRRDEDVSRVLSALKLARDYLSSVTVAKYLDDRSTGSKVTQTLAKRPPTVFVDPGDTLGSILDTLATHRLSSAPVIDRTNGSFSGFVDVHEILAIFVRACRKWLVLGTGYGSELDRPPVTTTTSETVGINPGRLRNEEYGDMKEADLVSNLQSTLGAGLFSQTLRAARLENPVHERGDGEAIYRGYKSASILALICGAFFHPMTKRPLSPTHPLACNHRVGVYDWDPAFDDGSKVTDASEFELVSQSDLIRLIHEHRDDVKIAPLMELSVRECGLLRSRSQTARAWNQQEGNGSGGGGSESPIARAAHTHAVPSDPGISLPAPYHYRGVLCVSASRTTALEAFALMDAERFSALGICDDEYKIVANVSISDLRGITPTNIHRLSLNIDEFLRQQRGSFSFGRAMSDNPGLDEMNDVVCCGIHATIGDVVSSMVSARLHHIYVVSSDGHPLSLVTPSDVLRLLSEELIEG